MKKALYIVAFLSLLPALSHAVEGDGQAPAYWQVISSPTAGKANIYGAGDLYLWALRTNSASSFNIVGGSVTKCGTFLGYNIPSTFQSIGASTGTIQTNLTAAQGDITTLKASTATLATLAASAASDIAGLKTSTATLETTKLSTAAVSDSTQASPLQVWASSSGWAANGAWVVESTRTFQMFMIGGDIYPSSTTIPCYPGKLYKVNNSTMYITGIEVYCTYGATTPPTSSSWFNIMGSSSTSGPRTFQKMLPADIEISSSTTTSGVIAVAVTVPAGWILSPAATTVPLSGTKPSNCGFLVRKKERLDDPGVNP